MTGNRSEMVKCEPCKGTGCDLSYAATCDYCLGAGEVTAQPLSDDVVERVARAMQPSLFGSPDSQVGPATLAERERHRKMAERAIAAISSQTQSDDVIERLSDFYRRLSRCFRGATGQAPPRRPRPFDPKMSDCNVLLDAAVALERARLAAIPSAGGVKEIERWKSKLLVVATARDRLAEHREKLIEEIVELRAALSRARNEQVQP